ncbi:MAG: hypothetical protein BJ554DRAFT_6280 [Olpidium bornovanus]|uniref:Uncharacterized protein n=1 Tax=Olpidium bornovanus TaxID=278681 RepID=A0A8H8DKB8_9FUNG|nr:MAG: hypothetical protein BJ554DRAFT_6280 [Olpidium bornovanus]
MTPSYSSAQKGVSSCSSGGSFGPSFERTFKAETATRDVGVGEIPLFEVSSVRIDGMFEEDVKGKCGPASSVVAPPRSKGLRHPDSPAIPTERGLYSRQLALPGRSRGGKVGVNARAQEKMEDVRVLAEQMRSAEVRAAVVQFSREGALFKEKNISEYLRRFEAAVRQ